jgi:hypothetical protein
MVASAQCILLATRSDLDGEVEVRVAGELVDQPAGQLRSGARWACPAR